MKILDNNFTISFYTLDNANFIYGLKFSNIDRSFEKAEQNSSSNLKFEMNSNSTDINNSNDYELNPDKKIEVLVGNRVVDRIPNITGIDATFKIQKSETNKIIYEMKIPLTVSNDIKFAINLFPFKQISNVGIALEASEEIKLNNSDKREKKVRRPTNEQQACKQWS